MRPIDLIRDAERLRATSSTRPRQTFLKRSVSSLYYALFHALAQISADKLIGAEQSPNRSDAAWLQTYRAFNHGTCRNKMNNEAMMKKFPAEISSFAGVFVELQAKRNNADYNPISEFSKDGVLDDIKRVKTAIAKLEAAPTLDLKAFATYLLLSKRSD